METPLVVAITGASAGLGRAIAHAYAKRGAKLGLMARNPEALAAAKTGMRESRRAGHLHPNRRLRCCRSRARRNPDRAGTWAYRHLGE